MSVELNSVVQEVIIDDSKAVSGSARVVDAMENMASAADRATAATKRQASGLSQLDAALQRSTPAQESALRRLNAWKAQSDPVEASLQRLSRAEMDLNRAITQGISTEQEKVRILDQLWAKLLGAAEAQEKLNAATRAQAAQGAFNTQLGVRDDFNGAARAADIEAYGRELDRLQTKFDPIYRAQQAMARETEDLNRAMQTGAISQETYSTGMARIQATSAGVETAIEQYTNEVQKAKAALDAGSISQAQFSTQLSAAESRFHTATGGLSGFASLSTRGQNSARQMGVAIQQAGYQVGDFAVQVASGQGVLRPFIQQGTQLVSMFGPWGAVLGAAGAVVGAIATSFFDMGKSADKAGDDAEKALKKSQDEARKLKQELQDVATYYERMILKQAQYEQSVGASQESSALRRLNDLAPGDDPIAAQRALLQAQDRTREGYFKELGVMSSIGARRDDVIKGVEAEISRNKILADAMSVSRHQYDVTTKALEIMGDKGFTRSKEDAYAAAEAWVKSREAIDEQTGSTKANTGEMERRTKAANDNIASMSLQAQMQSAVAAAYGISTAAGKQAELEMKAAIATVGLGNKVYEEYLAKLKGVEASQKAIASAQALANERQATALAQQKAINAQIGNPSQRHEADLALERQARLNELTDLYGKDIVTINKHMDQFTSKQRYDDQARYWNDVRGKALDVSNDISQFLIDGFVNAEAGGKSMFKNIWDGAMAGAKRFFANLAAEFLKQKFILPVVTQIVGDNSGLLGIVQAAGGVSGGTAGAGGVSGGGILSSLSSLASIGSLFSNGGALSGIGNVANWASNGLGLGSVFGGASATAVAQAAGTVGAHAAPYISGVTSGGTAAAASGGGLTAAMGAIPVWGWVAMAASVAKSFVEGAEPRSAKGTINTLLAPSIGEWQSQPRRSIANAMDPIGTALTDWGLPSFLSIGGIVGSLLGADKKPSNKFAYTGIDAAGGTIGAAVFDPSERSQATIDASQTMAQTFLDIAQQMKALTGGTLPSNAFAVVGQRDGIKVGVGGTNPNGWNSGSAAYGGPTANFASTEAGAKAAMDFMVQQLATQMASSVQDADYRRILQMGGSGEDKIANLTVAAQVKALSQGPDVSAASAQLTELLGKFSDLEAKARALGLATNDLVKAEKDQLAQLATGLKMNFASKVNDYIGAFLTPLQALQDTIAVSGQTTYDRFQAAQSLFRDVAAKAAQGNEVALSMLAQAGATYADLARNLESSTKPLRDFLTGLDSGPLSNLAPLAQLQTARGRFDELAGRANAGDSSVIGDLQSQAQTYLELARQYGGSGQIYQEAYQAVTTSLDGIIDKIDGAIGSVDTQAVLSEINGGISGLITELGSSRDTLLAGIAPSLNDMNSNFRTQIAVLQSEGVQTRGLLAQIASGILGVPVGVDANPNVTPVVPAPVVPSVQTPAAPQNAFEYMQAMNEYLASLGVGGGGQIDASVLGTRNGGAKGAYFALLAAQGHADGGPIVGPGTGTSDSVPFWGSNGEYVIRSASVQKFGQGAFDALNRGINPFGAQNDNGALVSEMRRATSAFSDGFKTFGNQFERTITMESRLQTNALIDEIRALRAEVAALRRDAKRDSNKPVQAA